MPNPQYAMKDFWPLYLEIANRDQWSRSSFHDKKAYLCCLLAELAYEHLQEHEVDQWNRIKLFPCATLEAAVAAGPSELNGSLFIALPGESMEVMLHVVETRFFISVIIHIGTEVVFVASRGTADAYDKRVDFDCKLVPPILGNNSLRMHHGFLIEALKHVDLIANRIALNEDAKNRPTIYTMGHSFGGAIAAILQALYFGGRLLGHPNSPYFFRRGWEPLVHLSDWFYVNSCYTYGMPRFAETTAVLHLPNPYSIIRPLDPIIYLPLHSQGYADGLREYDTNLHGAARRSAGPSRPMFRSLKNSATLRSWMTEHKCELYRQEIANALSIPFHATLLSL